MKLLQKKGIRNPKDEAGLKEVDFNRHKKDAKAEVKH